MAQPNSNEEKTESDDIDQFKVVSHNTLSNLKNLCKNVKNNTDLSGFSHVNFDNLGKEKKIKVEESLYEMMSKFKTTPLEFSNSIPKSLYDLVEQK